LSIIAVAIIRHREKRSDVAICISTLCHQRAHLFVIASAFVRHVNLSRHREKRSDVAICISTLCHQRAHLFVIAKVEVTLFTDLPI